MTLLSLLFLLVTTGTTHSSLCENFLGDVAVAGDVFSATADMAEDLWAACGSLYIPKSKDLGMHEAGRLGGVVSAPHDTNADLCAMYGDEKVCIASNEEKNKASNKDSSDTLTTAAIPGLPAAPTPPVGQPAAQPGHQSPPANAPVAPPAPSTP